ncbi:DUF1344 domain-containing protein [Stappia sediminis]|nr:DUF1344 domain-containing protein [Stappia sediminis]
MKFIAHAAGLMLSALIATSALAGETEAEIVQIDTDKGVIVLSDGESYSIPVDFYVDDLEPGMKVFVIYDEEGGEKVLADLQVEEQ